MLETLENLLGRYLVDFVSRFTIPLAQTYVRWAMPTTICASAPLRETQSTIQ